MFSLSKLSECSTPHRYHSQSSKSLEYAVQMTAPAQTDLESQIRLWIKRNKREDSRLEFKRRIDLSAPDAKAEFIRDVIAMANSEGENPRKEYAREFDHVVRMVKK
jgi:hypothetical protein